MSFEARVYIQGVGVYVPKDNEGKEEVHVLFPNQEKAEERNLHQYKGIPVCRHHAVVQFDTRYLAGGPHPGPTIPWTTLDITGLWVSLSAEPEGTPVETRLTTDGRVPGVPHIPDILHDLKPSAPLVPSLLWDAEPDFPEAEWLRAGLVLDAGMLSPYSEYEGLFDFDPSQVSRRPRQHRFSSVLKLELGQVNSFALKFRPFGSEEESTLHLSTPWDELEVWIRHFCNLQRPDPDLDLPSAGEDDTDFVLNYTFLTNLNEVLKASEEKGGLPVPKVASSWARGGHIGLESRKCMAVSA